MKKLISLLCVITLLLSQFVVVSAHSGCTASNTSSPIEKTALIAVDQTNTVNQYYVFLRQDPTYRALLLLELNLENLWSYLNETDIRKGVVNFKYAGLGIRTYSGTFTAAIYEVDNFDWSGYEKDKLNFIDYEGEDKLPFNKETDLINTYTINTTTPVLDISAWMEQKLIEGKTSVTIALDNITTEHNEKMYVGRIDYSSTGFHPTLQHRRIASNDICQLRDGNFNTTITDGYVFPDEDGTNYVFAKYQLGNETYQSVTDLGIQIGDTFYSLKKDGDTTEFNKALSSKCFGIGIKDPAKTLGPSYLAIPQIKMRDIVKENVYANNCIDDAFIKSGAGVSVDQ